MPTYDDLRGRFEESDDLRRVCSQASEYSIVDGLTLTVHPLWALLYDLDQYPEAGRQLLSRLGNHQMRLYPVDNLYSWLT